LKVVNKAPGRINKAAVVGCNTDLLRVVRSCWLVAARSINTKIYWYGKRPDTLGTGFFAEVLTLVGQWVRTRIRRTTLLKVRSKGQSAVDRDFAARHGQKIAWLVDQKSRHERM
jgi:hypothetical protein